MAFALIIVGLVLLVTAVKDTASGPNGLFALVAGDFSGSNNFLYWMTAILIIGAIGYIPKLKPISTACLGLIIVVLVLTKGAIPGSGGLFQQFTAGLATTAAAAPAASSASTPASSVATASSPLALPLLSHMIPITGVLQ